MLCLISSHFMLGHCGVLTFSEACFVSSLLCRLTKEGPDPCVTPVFSLTSSLPLPLPPLEVVSSLPEAEGTPVSTTLVDLHP